MKKQRRRRIRLIILIAVFCVIASLAGGALYIWKNYQITMIYVEGNTHYTDEEITDYVMGGRFAHNSIVLSLMYKNKEITGIPFVQAMDIKILSRNTVKIMVYEKSLAGYVSYLGRYFYFDKDGIVVESAAQRTEGIPQVSGLHFESVTLYEPLPIGDDSVFGSILSITQLLSKYKLAADKISFSEDYEMTLYFGDVRVILGTSAYIDEKVTRLQHILPNLSGQSGVLDMRDYQDTSDTVTFMKD
ncbi:MAG: cell division protein FtsQ/DivIB [Clostridium sp.]|nr:cell division protein FtsQ/DivIB [Clostridium sp.]